MTETLIGNGIVTVRLQLFLYAMTKHLIRFVQCATEECGVGKRSVPFTLAHDYLTHPQIQLCLLLGAPGDGGTRRWLPPPGGPSLSSGTLRSFMSAAFVPSYHCHFPPSPPHSFSQPPFPFSKPTNNANQTHRVVKPRRHWSKRLHLAPECKC